MAYRLLLILTGAVLLCLPASCATRPPNAPSESTLPHPAVRAVEVRDDEPLLYISLFNHPYQFESDALEALMGSLEYSPIDPHFRGTVRPIFPEPTIREAAPLIRKAFRDAKPYQKIQFEVQTPKGLTAGDTFILEEELHWRFSAIQGIPQYENFYNIYQFGTDTSLPRNWELSLQEGQHYFADELILGVKKVKTNWVVLNLPPHPDGETQILKKGHNDVQPEKGPENLLDRLHFLQKLKGDGLISSEDFHRKIHALMEAKGLTGTNPEESLRFLKELRDTRVISENEYKERVQEVLEPL